MSTGAFFRAERDGKWGSVEIEYLTSEERTQMLRHHRADELLLLVDVLCDQLAETEYALKKEVLVVGLVQRQRDLAWELLKQHGIAPPIL